MQRSMISSNCCYMLHQRFKTGKLISIHFLAHKRSSSFAWPSVANNHSFGSLSFPSLVLWRGYSSKTSLLIRKMSTRSSMSIEKQMVPENEVEQVKLLDAVEDLHGGVVVEMKENMDSEIFVPLLRASMSQWRYQGKKGAWIKLPIQLSYLVDPVVQAGFRYHHAEADYLMLVKWLPSTPDTLPINASHRVGIGAFIVNNNREEKSGGFKGTGVWKLPTGVVNEGEDICKAAVREVKEETGIDAEFVEVLAFRQSHQSFFGKSDLFFVCMLRPLSFNIQVQESEIEAAQWMPIEEYVNQPYNQKYQLFKYVAEICKAKSERDYVGFSAVAVATASGKETYMYFNNRDFSKL
ncbi:nudix hydrolase 2 isoform X2 [Ricinus communis]|uniref:nudix hydrolase 2 isoform X2 n=1 Tax=Ricinus communis TaxID=3988 RepID=UPI00201AD75B|nr:nudix hydrolase 2 isoform X2 [Ricinus communis]